MTCARVSSTVGPGTGGAAAGGAAAGGAFGSNVGSAGGLTPPAGVVFVFSGAAGWYGLIGGPTGGARVGRQRHLLPARLRVAGDQEVDLRLRVVGELVLHGPLDDDLLAGPLRVGHAHLRRGGVDHHLQVGRVAGQVRRVLVPLQV